MADEKQQEKTEDEVDKGAANTPDAYRDGGQADYGSAGEQAAEGVNAGKDKAK